MFTPTGEQDCCNRCLQVAYCGIESMIIPATDPKMSKTGLSQTLLL